MTDALVFGDTADIEVTDEMFSGEQILTAIGELSVYQRYTDVSKLEGGDYDADTLEAFAKLARSLKATIHTYGLNIRREKPADELRKLALSALRDQAERGDIRPAYLDGRPE